MSKSYKSNKVFSFSEDALSASRRRGITALIVIVCIIFILGLFVAAVALANTLIDDDWQISKDNVVEGALLKVVRSQAKVEYESQLIPGVDSDGRYYFDIAGREGGLKIVQLTDVHIGGGSFSHQKDLWAINAVAKMLQEEKPDLVIVTGDIAYPVPFQAGTFNNLRATKIFASLMETLGVYWTFAYGNHDTEAYSMYTREDINNWYMNQKADGNLAHCIYNGEDFSEAVQRDCIKDAEKLYRDAEDLREIAGQYPDNTSTYNDYIEQALAKEEEAAAVEAKAYLPSSNKKTPDAGFGNQIIRVKNGAQVVQDLVLLDSHSYTDNDYFGMMWKYDNIHQSQIDWYADNLDKNTDGTPVNNLLFFHIPLKEYRDAYQQVKDGTLELKYGKMGEEERERNGVKTYGIFCGENDDSLFETGLNNNLKGIFCGHDHYNNFSVDYNGVRLTYGMSIDYLAYTGIYKKHAQRGCTVITIDAEGNFENEPRNYYSDYEVSVEKGSSSDVPSNN